MRDQNGTNTNHEQDAARQSLEVRIQAMRSFIDTRKAKIEENLCYIEHLDGRKTEFPELDHALENYQSEIERFRDELNEHCNEQLLNEPLAESINGLTKTLRQLYERTTVSFPICTQAFDISAGHKRRTSVI